jgi:hypothetical protein
MMASLSLVGGRRRQRRRVSDRADARTFPRGGLDRIAQANDGRSGMLEINFVPRHPNG